MHFFYSPPMLIIYIFIIATLDVHYHGKVQHSFFRQLSDHSTFLAPINAFIYLFSAVPNAAFLDERLFPEVKPLEENWQTIRDEALALLSDGAIKASAKFDDAGFNSFFKSGWKRFYVKWYGKAHPSALKYCPKTVAWLQQIPNIKAAMFTYLPPGARLVRHRDPYAGSLRYHLGLSTPNSDLCVINVDGESRSWRDGKSLFFDETLIHYADNQTDKGRLILLCDIERPMRYIIPAWINRFFAWLLLKAAASPNEVGDKTGWINHAFKWLYYIRILGKKIKQKNKVIYYILKYLLFIGLIYLVLFSWY